MTKPKGILQKVSLVSGYISFLLALVSGVALYLREGPVNNSDAISASLAATTFFFFCVGIVLIIMGKADIPSFKIDKPDDQ
jgi:vacuolar-type H+-ATPase subunit I/STV1